MALGNVPDCMVLILECSSQSPLHQNLVFWLWDFAACGSSSGVSVAY